MASGENPDNEVSMRAPQTEGGGAKTQSEHQKSCCSDQETSPSGRVRAFRTIPAGERGIRDDIVERMSKRFDVEARSSGETAHVRTLYKRKAQKVRPQNVPKRNTQSAGGETFWKDAVLAEERERLAGRPVSKWDKYFIPRFTEAPEGSRLTPERRETIQIGMELSEAERELLFHVLQNREMALAWGFEDIRRIRKEVAPPQVIHTVEHEPWQAPNMPIPKPLQEIALELVREKLRAGIFEHGDGPYRNPWFLVKKKNGKYRMVTAAMILNGVTIKDANLPPSADSFSEEFAGMAVGSLIDFFSGYDQIELAEGSRDMTAIMTALGLLRQTTVLQGATNSVGQFVRVIVRILQELIPHIAIPFMDDIAVRGPRSRYDDKEMPGLPGVRRFVMEHIQNLDVVLADLERAGGAISALKSIFCAAILNIVGYRCDEKGRYPDYQKVVKIVEWPACESVTECRAFLGVCVYYRIWIIEFAIVAEPIYRLLRINVVFVWGREQQVAMEKLKLALTTAPALMPLDYSEGAGEIVVGPDASLNGWGGTLGQRDREGRMHPSRYESGLWSPAERKYDAGKRECRALLLCLKKFRHYLYGIQFVVETDARVLRDQLNKSAADLPGAMITRWMAWIRLFDFEVRHVPGKKHTAADGLSRRPGVWEENGSDDENDDFIDADLSCVRVAPVVRPVQDTGEAGVKICPVASRDSQSEHQTPVMFTSGNSDDADNRRDLSDADADPDEGMAEYASEDEDDTVGEPEDDRWPVAEEDVWNWRENGPLRPGYSETSQQIAGWLLKPGTRPPGLEGTAYRRFKGKAMRFFTRNGHLFLKASKNVPLRRVVDKDEDRIDIMQALHEQSGHRGTETTYRKIADRYYWENMSYQVQRYVRSCPECQFRAPNRTYEELHPTYVAVAWRKVGVDIVYMPPDLGFNFMVLARDDFTGWVEGRPLRAAKAKDVARFLKEEILYRHGQWAMLVVDGGPEFLAEVPILSEKYGIQRIQISPYHSQAAGMIEKGHIPVRDALAKLALNGRWVSWFYSVLWADRISFKSTTGMSPFRLEYGYDPILPVELEVESWAAVAWSSVQTTDDLLALRAMQLERRQDLIEEVGLKIRRHREEGKVYFDNTHVTRDPEKPIKQGDLVLVHNTSRKKDMSTVQKQSFKWLGPYRVFKAYPKKGFCMLEDLNGVRQNATVSGDRLKLFCVRELRDGGSEGFPFRYYGGGKDQGPAQPENETQTNVEENEEANAAERPRHWQRAQVQDDNSDEAFEEESEPEAERIRGRLRPRRDATREVSPAPPAPQPSTGSRPYVEITLAPWSGPPSRI